MANRAEAAIGNLILCTLPVRRRALATTDWRRNFRPPSRRGGNATLIYYPEQSKTKRPQQVIVDGWKWRLIELYWKHYRPLLSGADRSTYLFPGNTTSGHKSGQKLADAITNLVRKRTGLVMNLHLWRHVMGAKLLEEHEDMHLVEELLGHVPGSRATRRYAELKTKWAARRLDGITDQARGRGLHLYRRRVVPYDRRISAKRSEWLIGRAAELFASRLRHSRASRLSCAIFGPEHTGRVEPITGAPLSAGLRPL